MVFFIMVIYFFLHLINHMKNAVYGAVLRTTSFLIPAYDGTLMIHVNPPCCNNGQASCVYSGRGDLF